MPKPRHPPTNRPVKKILDKTRQVKKPRALSGGKKASLGRRLLTRDPRRQTSTAYHGGGRARGEPLPKTQGSIAPKTSDPSA